MNVKFLIQSNDVLLLSQSADRLVHEHQNTTDLVDDRGRDGDGSFLYSNNETSIVVQRDRKLDAPRGGGGFEKSINSVRNRWQKIGDSLRDGELAGSDCVREGFVTVDSGSQLDLCGMAVTGECQNCCEKEDRFHL